MRRCRFASRASRYNFTLFLMPLHLLLCDSLLSSQPKSHKDLILNAVHLLNSVTIPPGSQYGTDSGDGEGEGDHTIFGVVYDHTAMTMYLRSYENQSLQRISFDQLALQTPGAEKMYLPVVNSNAWFIDAADSFSSRK